MTDFLLELLCEEIPARMQAKASADLARLFEEQLKAAGLAASAIETYATPRRLALIARGLPEETGAVREELKGPRTSAPPQALEGFLRKTGLGQDQLVDRDGIWFAILDRPGRASAAVLAEAVPAIVRGFPWPKSMRWGAASASTESLRWVRPLQGILALLGEEIVDFEIAGLRSGAATVGHRFHHPGIITIGGAHDYAEKLRACHVILDPAERSRIIAQGAAAAAAAAGLALVEDQGLLAENAGLTEWPVPLLGRFDPAFLDVPPEVIQLTMRVNQKYFALSPLPVGEGAERSEAGEGDQAGPSPSRPRRGRAPPSPSGRGALAPCFICTANIEAADGGGAIIAGNEKVLAARLSDAKFFWEQDLKVPLEDQARKLSQIVFHEKLGTLADKVDRVAKLARWLVEEGIVKSSPSELGEGDHAQHGGGARSGAEGSSSRSAPGPSTAFGGPPPRAGEELASLAERAARLCKADLVTQMVGEFPELQGVIGGYLAAAQGEDPHVADAIRDHYKPVGQDDEVPTAPVTVAVSLADKLDTIAAFFAIAEKPTGSKDPFALRRAAFGVLALLTRNSTKLPIRHQFASNWFFFCASLLNREAQCVAELYPNPVAHAVPADLLPLRGEFDDRKYYFESARLHHIGELDDFVLHLEDQLLDFFADRLKVQQREAGVRHDLIDAVFALGGEDDLVRLLARVKALQSFVETPEGADLLAGYKRAANILRKEDWTSSEQKILSYTPVSEEAALIAALDEAEPRAAAAVEEEDFEGAMAALASLRSPVDAFFDKVTVNDADPARREARLALLARIRAAVHRVADFSRIEG